jgi:ankyrin repeat protein
MNQNVQYRLNFLMLLIVGCLGTANAGEIHDAAWRGDVKRIEVLLKENPKLVESEDGAHFRPLYFAINYSHPETVECLLQNGADINGVSTNGAGSATWTPIQTAMFTGYKHDELVDLLLKHGAKCGIVEAAALGKLEIVKKLVKDDPSLVKKTCNFGFSKEDATALYWAAARGRRDVVDFLLENKAEKEIHVGQIQYTPLLIAIFYGNKDVVISLLVSGADPNVKDALGRTGLHLLADAGPAYGIDPGPNPKPLNWAASQDQLEIAQALLRKGADVNSKDNSGRTPLKAALNPGGSVPNLGELLRKHGGHE